MPLGLAFRAPCVGVRGDVEIGFLTQPGHAVLPPAGSLEIWTHHVARRLAARGHEVFVYASGRARAARRGRRPYRFVDHGVDGRLARVVRPAYRALPAIDRTSARPRTRSPTG